jgi:hypothetical protein
MINALAHASVVLKRKSNNCRINLPTGMRANCLADECIESGFPGA